METAHKRYVVLVAVHAELINPPSRYRCSIAATHAGEKDDTPALAPLLEMAPNWRAFLARVIQDGNVRLLRAHKRTGQPLGDEALPAMTPRSRQNKG